MKSKLIFVDTDAFVALAKSNDTNHQKAKKALNSLLKKPVSFLTSNYVFSEAVTVISQRVGHLSAVSFINQIKNPKSIFIIKQANKEVDQLAIKIFLRQKSKNVSFVDCANMAMVNLFKIDAIFSFDKIYQKNGFKLA